MEKEFVTYEIASALKELGFDEPCLAVFSDDECCDLIHVCENQTEGNFIIESFQYGTKAPLWQQAIDWFRIKHKIDIFVNPIETMLFPKRTYQSRVLTKTSITIGGPYDIYEKAREPAILKAIELCQKK